MGSRAGTCLCRGPPRFLFLDIARDLIVNRRIHSVYKYGLPVFVLGQAFAMFVVVTKPAWWAKFALAIVG